MSDWSAARFGPEDAPLLVATIHGGFWRARVDAASIAPLATTLAEAGHRVWNLEYPRVGEVGGGWPGTAEAAAAALDALLQTAGGRPVVVLGHSAGGHLALWASRGRPVAGVIALAPVCDLRAARRAGLGEGAVEEFIGAPPEAAAEAYLEASPGARLPLGVPALLIHGDADQRVPIAQSRAYVEAARAAGDEVELVELTGADHMELIDPEGRAWAPISGRLRAAG
ncbi:MAG TPA: alpha/beta fold hydrolase [Solirubrobacterales bacterium]|nr:alpha/beta fold hydrolase [Solirubrobacterales bacterium]